MAGSNFVITTLTLERAMSSVLETLSNEQLAALLPLLPALANYSQTLSATETAKSSGSESESSRNFTNEEMFARKKKSTCSTAAQTYLLVSGHYVMHVCGLQRNVVTTKPHTHANNKRMFCGKCSPQSVRENFRRELVRPLLKSLRFILALSIHAPSSEITLKDHMHYISHCKSLPQDLEHFHPSKITAYLCDTAYVTEFSYT